LPLPKAYNLIQSLQAEEVDKLRSTPKVRSNDRFERIIITLTNTAKDSFSKEKLFQETYLLAHSKEKIRTIKFFYPKKLLTSFASDQDAMIDESGEFTLASDPTEETSQRRAGAKEFLLG